MADTKFIEVLPNHGVDDDAVPIPEMIVPLRGTNHILLINGDGVDVKAEKPHVLEITEVKDFVRKSLPNPHMWRLKGLALPGEGGLLVQARKGTTVAATLRVFVLENRIVRLAVRPLQTAPGVFPCESSSGSSRICLWNERDLDSASKRAHRSAFRQTSAHRRPRPERARYGSL